MKHTTEYKIGQKVFFERYKNLKKILLVGYIKYIEIYEYGIIYVVETSQKGFVYRVAESDILKEKNLLRRLINLFINFSLWNC